MRIVWDEPKRLQNLAKHGLDFLWLDLAFFDDALIVPGSSGRAVAIGEFQGATIVAVVFKPPGIEALSIVSMRPASRKERRLRWV
ncbi:BrnT family toxin [Shinella sp.]|uniref:BrnT family toxin n=1 Tax=Shinella sp. TaxID=1870904 RepID=UPI003F717F84